MKAISILSLVQAYSSLESESYAKFLDHYDINIKNEEAEDLAGLVKALYPHGNNTIFNEFYVGFKIPQIGKEFDLLRIGDNLIVNIEIKRNASEERIHKQLQRNKYYLTSTAIPVYNFSFISSTMSLYFLNEMNAIQLVDFTFLINILESQAVHYIDNIDNLFNPSVYLVSPFNSTDRFINGEYFLTHQQEEIKEKIKQTVTNKLQSSFISITGSAGTGKTLLVYDIAKDLIINNYRVLIIHCGNLNNGQVRLRLEHNWEIIPIKHYATYDLSDYNMVIIDEAQRITQQQLETIESTIRSSNGKCIFSYDKVQTLSTKEEYRNIDGRINNISQINAYKLTEKIRTNKEIASFIKALFHINKEASNANNGNIEINYFSDIDDAKSFLVMLGKSGWEVLRFTPSQYNTEHHESYSFIASKASHAVIGQEFDNVAVVIDQFFSYSSNGELIYIESSYYHPVKMLFQNLTRTRKKLNVVIINNRLLLDRCISIINNQ